MRSLGTLFLLSALLSSSLAQGEKNAFRQPLISSELGGREMTFLVTANEHGVLLDYLAELARTRGGSAPLQSLGESLAKTQSTENSRLVQVAVTKGVSFPAQTPPTMKPLRAKLEPLSGDAFDQTLVKEIATLTKASIENHQTGAKSRDEEIKAFAEQGLSLAKEKRTLVEKVATAETPR